MDEFYQLDTARTTLARLPSSRLGRLVRVTTLSQVANMLCLVVSRSSQLLSLCDEFTPSRPPVYFFDRNPDNFCTVVQLYRSREVGLARSAVLLYCSGRSCTWCRAGAALLTSRLTSSTGVLTSSVSSPAALSTTSLRWLPFYNGLYYSFLTCGEQLDAAEQAASDARLQQEAEEEEEEEVFGDSKFSRIRIWIWDRWQPSL